MSLFDFPLSHPSLSVPIISWHRIGTVATHDQGHAAIVASDAPIFRSAEGARADDGQGRGRYNAAMNLILYLVIGGLAGFLAGRLLKGRGFGLIVNVVVGVAGSFVGGWVFGLLGIRIGGGMLGSLVTATAGAVILLAVLNALKGR